MVTPGSRSRLPAPTRTWRRTGERQAELAATAARQFHRLGFHQVSVADVARLVGLTAPAVYRHYANKEELLAAAIRSALAPVHEALTGAADDGLHEFLQNLSRAAVAHRELWVLLQREMRHLGPDSRRSLEDQFAQIVRMFTAHVRRERPDLDTPAAQLVTTATLAALSSPSLYRSRLPEELQQAVLAAAAEAVCRVEWAPPEAHSPPATPDGGGQGTGSAATRSEEVLGAAIRLFAERGYQAVSLDDIGAELGMAGPSLLYHFAAKADLLVAAFVQATQWLAAQRDRSGQVVSLEELVDAFVELGVRERLLFKVYVWEAVNLPPTARRRIQAGLDADVRAWCTALGRVRSELTVDQRLVLVHAARAIVHDVVRLGHWSDRTDITEVLRTLVHAALTAQLER